MTLGKDGRVEYNKSMKKLVLAVFTISLLLPTPAHALFNRDCSNLRNRTITNQKAFDVSWDKYQTAYGKWQRLTDATMKFQNTEGVNRLRATLMISEKTLLDLRTNSKCVKTALVSGISLDLAAINKAYQDINGNGGFALMNNYLQRPIDFLSYLK